MDIFATIAERKILEAIQRGELDNLALKGQPIRRDDTDEVPEELRMGYKILKNAGVLPEELQLNREIVTLKNLVDSCENQEERRWLKKRLSEQMLRYNLMMERNFKTAAYRQYEEKIVEKLHL